MHIFIGVVVVLIYFWVFQPAKLPVYRIEKDILKKIKYDKLIVSIYEISLRFIRNGIYFKVPYQLQVPPIKTNGNTYYFFGDIGNFGYYAEKQIVKGEQSNLYLVSWKDLFLEYPIFFVQYPSGKEEIWDTKISLIEKAGNKMTYRVSAFTFKEVGIVKIKIPSKEEAIFSIDVKENC
ncbi:hypothetical protein GCM10011351_00040 [Paraliobacillus quinghaiensis]|uniref:Uncharacterized protein n=1 Tax=Paraliobacillus quinghaiensis TaxID=470815 RepID=A0A917WNB3_9BACI|nr:hypothetical protein [Paraliobacillus quinghaiensis]GGM18267.1 hypothetical protein GCM10011351_00040 [Paraliobacillus quinghaiensis]